MFNVSREFWRGFRRLAVFSGFLGFVSFGVLLLLKGSDRMGGNAYYYDRFGNRQYDAVSGAVDLCVIALLFTMLPALVSLFAGYVVALAGWVIAGFTPDSPAPEIAKSYRSKGLLQQPVEGLAVGVAALNGLQKADIKYIGELVQWTEQDMITIKHFSRESLKEVKEILSDMGLSLGTRLENFPTRAELDRMWEEAPPTDN